MNDVTVQATVYMMTDEGKLAVMNVVQVSEVISSNAKEKGLTDAFKTLPEKTS